MIPAIGNAEEQLAAFLMQLEPKKIGWQVAFIHLSRLSPAFRRAFSVRIALNSLHDQLGRFEGRLFRLSNNDVVALVRGATVADVNEAIFKLKALYQDDPLAQRDGAFATWYDLSVSLAELLDQCRQMIARKAQREAAATAESLPAGDGEPLDPLRLSKLQSILASLDLSAHIRRQSVCVMLPDHKPERVFDEIYVRIADLQRPLMPNVDFLGNRWLFQTLTQLLDTRVLALIARRPGDYLNGPISLNLNVDTLMSEAFLNFDEAIKSGSQQSIVIEIQAFDLIANVRSFMMGREFLHSRGYRLCLDGLNAITLPLFERDTLGFDLFKVLWDETLDAGLDSARAANFAKSIAAINGPRVIMARCQDDHAINFAHKLGLAMLQGRAVDSRLNPQARHRNRN